MRKNQLNFTVDAAAFVAFVSLATTGVLMRYILPPGSGHSNALWGMDRHAWGQIHFWLAALFVGAVGVHLALHWRWLVATVRGDRRRGATRRLFLAAAGLFIVVAVSLAPLLSPVEQKTGTDHAAYRIDGSMSLDEAARRSGVGADAVLRELGLPPGTPTDARISRLRRQYGFSMAQVREVVWHLAQTR